MKANFKGIMVSNGLNIEERVDYGYDTCGRLVIRGINKDEKRSIYHDHKTIPFNKCDFITINREDAENILSMLNESICLLESGVRDDNDIEVFGDRAISYERLIDALGGTIWETEEKKDEEEK